MQLTKTIEQLLALISLVLSMIKVKLFGIAKDIVSNSYYTIDSGIKVSELKSKLIAEYPAFSDLKSVLIAVNNEYANDDVLIQANDEVVIIPPVSGG